MKQNAVVWYAAALTVIGSIAADFLELLIGGNIKALTDITDVQVAIVLLKGVIFGVTVFVAKITDSPANVRQTNDIVAAAANLDQKGFVRPQFAALLIFVSLLAIALSGCATQQLKTPRAALLDAYSTATTVANGIEIAKRDGHITAEQRDIYLNDVRRVRTALNEARALLANDPAAGSVNDSAAVAKLRFAQEILISIQAALAQEQTQ